MRVFTREQMNHLDIDQAFATHTHNSKIKNNPTPVITSRSLLSSDNLIIVLLILLLLIENKEKHPSPTS